MRQFDLFVDCNPLKIFSFVALPVVCTSSTCLESGSTGVSLCVSTFLLAEATMLLFSV